MVKNLTEKYYICPSDITLRASNESEIIFNHLQSENNRLGYSLSMYSFNL